MKTITTYLLLVGLPVLGVLLILRLGQNLTAPISVGGEWRIEAPASPAVEAGCGAVWERLAQASLHITQSGPQLRVTLNTDSPVELAGVVTAVQVAAHDSRSTASLQATVDRAVEPDTLSGSLTVPGCSTALAFTALRQPAALTGANH